MTQYPYKDITSHHDGHGLTETIKVYAMDEPGPGGACHHYEFFVDLVDGAPERGGYQQKVGYLQFQKGPRNEPGSIPGVLTVAVLAGLIDQMEDFQAGPYPSDEGGEALDHLRAAMDALRRRADARAERGVLGVNAR